MKNNFQKISLLLSAVLFLFLCFAFFFLYEKINSNNQKAQQSTVTWQTEANRRDKLTLLNNSLGEITGDKATLQAHFVQNSDIIPFLNTIEALAPSVGAKAEIDSVENGTNNTGLTAEVKVSGSFGQIYKFLTLLENSPYEIGFLSMDLHKSEVPDDSGKNVKSSNWEAIFKIQLLSFTS
jgi:hypothetical protein